ncbi:hypothetical protein [uncultured Flavobacterium sp.]|jgi:hypothetical protein|uniref:hypothetical protein n=1 Tax=uncultured Flavobacterium sp. TaxID=165435 RepID=UPI0030CA160D
MKSILYLLIFFILFAVFSQQKVVEITNIKTSKVKIFEENQRGKIRTLDGKKYIGNLKFSDSLTIVIKNQSIEIDSIQSIKKQPKVLATIKTVVLVAGLAVVGSLLVAASSGSNWAFLLFTTGSSVTISAGLLEGLNSNYSDNRWTFKIIEQ